MEIVKVQKRKKDVILGVPVKMQHLVKGIEYMKCTEVEGGLLYTKVVDEDGWDHD